MFVEEEDSFIAPFPLPFPPPLPAARGSVPLLQARQQLYTAFPLLCPALLPFTPVYAVGSAPLLPATGLAVAVPGALHMGG